MAERERMSQRIRASFEDPLGLNEWVEEIGRDQTMSAWQSRISEALRCVLTLPHPEGRQVATIANLLVEEIERCGLRMVQIESFALKMRTHIQVEVAKSSLSKLGFVIHQTDRFVCGFKHVETSKFDGVWCSNRHGSVQCVPAYFVSPPKADIASVIISPDFASSIERGDWNWALSRSAIEALASSGCGFFYGTRDQADAKDAVVITLSRKPKPFFDAISSSPNVERCAVSRGLHPFVV